MAVGNSSSSSSSCSHGLRTSSNGVWQGDNPLDFALPLLIVQTTLVLLVSRSLAFLIKPLRQPSVVAEIAGGILLGPSALGRNKVYLNRVFPIWSTPTLETVAGIGLIFFLFLVGLELDLSSVHKGGCRVFTIAAAGISLPFACGALIALPFRTVLNPHTSAGYTAFLVFMGVSLSVTAFPVLARILAELKLLTTNLGETAMAAAALNDLAAWVLLALATALSSRNNTDLSHHSSNLLSSLWVLLGGAAFVAAMLLIVRPLMSRASSQTPEGAPVSELHVCAVLVGVMTAGLATDLLGIHAIFGAFVFGICIPREGALARMLVERVEDFVAGLLLPLYFASSGLKTNVGSISGARSWGMLGLVIVTGCAGKVAGTFVAAVIHRVPAQEALTLGFLMNTKGLVELIVLNIGRERKVLNEETFAILVLMALFSTFITTPIVMALYNPSSHPHRHHLHLSVPTPRNLHFLACLHHRGSTLGILTLFESIRGPPKTPLKLYLMHLTPLSERPSSMLFIRRARRNGLPSVKCSDFSTPSFPPHPYLAKVSVRPMTAISSLISMHQDICNVAAKKHASLILLDYTLEHSDTDIRAVNQRVLQEAPCPIAMLVNRGLGGATDNQVFPNSLVLRVCVIFLGGPDCRKALELAIRMAEHPRVKVAVVSFILPKSGGEISNPNVANTMEKELMEEIAERGDSITYDERVMERANDVMEAVVSFGRSSGYDMVVVGRGRFPGGMLPEWEEQATENGELGQLGEALVANSVEIMSSSVLVVQQQIGRLQHMGAEQPKKVVENDARLSP
ncbi:cation/H(+) antiporter 20 isoform X1 [Amborella trichopoda]|nr:cation/H(+) antiporter 20 isoform X1 [Amborella trichopoda]|eukprot:XP_011624157.1 cation/H(+) antiporter 20 isoform X1 [Amborella trichopoda]